MTLPESAGRASPDDPGPVAGDGDQDDGAEPPSPDQVLTEKPVLEWTKEDWARWIDASSRVPVASPAPAHAPAEADDGDDADEGQGPAPAMVDTRLPEDEPAGSVVDSERPWDEPPTLADLAAEAEPSAPEPPPAAIADDERPWDEPPDLATQLQAQLEEELAPPPLVWPLADDRPPMPGTLLRRQPAAPPAPPPAAPRPSRPLPPTAAVERSHRLRSVLALLGVAVSVGVIVAGLITVTVFAVGVALRRAVG